MKRIVLSIAESILSHLGALGVTRSGTRRITSDSKVGRQMISKRFKRSRSKVMPHIGKKEQERAQRCYMASHYPMRNGVECPQSAPTMCQMSKRDYINGPF